MKFLKYLGIGLAAFVSLLIIFAIVLTIIDEVDTKNYKEAVAEAEQIEREKNKIVITELTKSFMEVELGFVGKSPCILGKCNYPDSTDFDMALIKDNSVVGGGGGKTIAGQFLFRFDLEDINSDDLSITCTKHENFHSANVLKQLKLVDPGVFQIKHKFCMTELKRKYYKKLFEYEAPQKLDMNTVKVEDWTRELSTPTKRTWKRKSIILTADPQLGENEIISQLKHLMIEELVKDATIVAVEANYREIKDFTKWRLTYAPNGDWLQENFDSYSDYKLVRKDKY